MLWRALFRKGRIMPLRFGDIELLGPFGRLDELEDQPGLFVILCYQDTTFEALDVRIADLVQTEVAEALNEPIWIDMCTGKLRVAVLYSSNESVLHYNRLRIVSSEGLTESKDLANVLSAKGRAAMDEGKYDDAVRYYRAATKSLERTFGEEDKRLLILLEALHKLLKDHGEEGAAFGVQERIKRIIGKDQMDAPIES
jgi:tetratricopeptide (TPR) repeat protein